MPIQRQGSFASVYSSFAPPPPPGRPRPRSLAVEPPALPTTTKDNDYVNVDDLQWEENSDTLPEEWTQRFTRTQSRELEPKPSPRAKENTNTGQKILGSLIVVLLAFQLIIQLTILMLMAWNSLQKRNVRH